MDADEVINFSLYLRLSAFICGHLFLGGWHLQTCLGVGFRSRVQRLGRSGTPAGQGKRRVGSACHPWGRERGNCSNATGETQKQGSAASLAGQAFLRPFRAE